MSEGAQDYRAVLIVKPDAEADAGSETEKRFAKEISRVGGELKRWEPQGKRKLAYKIKRATEGRFVEAAFTLAPQAVDGLRRAVALLDPFLRMMVLRRTEEDGESEQSVPDRESHAGS